MKRTMIVSIAIVTLAFMVYAVVSLDQSKNEILLPAEEPQIEFKELKWDWYGPTSIPLGEPIEFSVSHMDKFCDESFVAKIVNQDHSKIFWEDSSEPECIDIKGGKISNASFPANKPIMIDNPGSYFVRVDFGYGGPGLAQTIDILEPEDAKAVVVIPLGSVNPESQKNFEPETIIVVIGINNTVTWINQDEVPSSVVSSNYGEKGFGSPHLLPGDSWKHTFTKPGVFEYHSNPHPWKHGKVVVIDSAG